MQMFKSCTEHLPESNFIGLLALTPPAPGHDCYSLKPACLTGLQSVAGGGKEVEAENVSTGC